VNHRGSDRRNFLRIRHRVVVVMELCNPSMSAEMMKIFLLSLSIPFSRLPPTTRETRQGARKSSDGYKKPAQKVACIPALAE
jgi:hypothetical protein